MTWIVTMLAAWLPLSVAAALVVGRGIRLADRQERAGPVPVVPSTRRTELLRAGGHASAG